MLDSMTTIDRYCNKDDSIVISITRKTSVNNGKIANWETSYTLYANFSEINLTEKELIDLYHLIPEVLNRKPE